MNEQNVMKKEYETPDVEVITVEISNCIMDVSGGDTPIVWGSSNDTGDPSIEPNN